ncbi:MAG: MerR family transcriptional regulator [Neisseria sp.]|uniref:MerR family transcriptional regulator n=1 Tax=Neisseria sp. TaxID=192066 RepID=UPI0026DD8078|nr:MerR family transcriptional regulator [Neisseria sp.]MDO4641245.1 MerR family transcriptional regulator [Neisseria sp.]
MKIQAFSKQTGLSVDTLRYYEKEGLLQPERDSNGYRCYTERDAEWVAFIVRLKETNMPLAQIKNYARLRHMGDKTMAERYQILLEHQQYLAKLQTQLAAHQEYLTNKLKIYQGMMDKK